MKLKINKTRNQETTNYSQEENSSKLSKCPICSEITIKQSHYGGNSCQSCAAFFRRNTVSPTKVSRKCKNGMGNCLLSFARINNCPYCRYKYCLQNGLNPQLVKARTLTQNNACKVQNENTVENLENSDSDKTYLLFMNLLKNDAYTNA